MEKIKHNGGHAQGQLGDTVANPPGESFGKIAVGVALGVGEHRHGDIGTEAGKNPRRYPVAGAQQRLIGHQHDNKKHRPRGQKRQRLAFRKIIIS